MRILQNVIARFTTPKPDLAAALAYVRSIEWSWGQEGNALSHHLRFDGVWLWRIETPSNLWDVWLEPSGRIYGEC